MKTYDVLLSVQYCYDVHNTYWEVVTVEARGPYQAASLAMGWRPRETSAIGKTILAKVVQAVGPCGSYDKLIGKRVGHLTSRSMKRQG